MKMKLSTILTVEEFQDLSLEWNQLLECCSASHVPFLRHEYLDAWWKTMGGGEWQEGKLNIIIARDESEGLVGIAPLFRTSNLDGESALMLLGSIEISDYLDLIINPAEIDTFLPELLKFLSLEPEEYWAVIDLYNIPEDSPTLPALKTASEEQGWAFQQEQLQPCPYIPLPGDWDEYLANIKKKQRHEIRRKIRRAENHPENVRWYIVKDRNQLDQEINDFMDLMSQDKEKEDFLTQKMRNQLRETVFAAFDAGWLQLSFLEVNGQKAGGYLNFDFADHIWVYNSGFNFDYRELSPGWVLLGYLLKWANENQRLEFDFMRGDEDYKYRFGGINRFVERVKISRSSD
jgi:CelD/BcsL family acetyltransferase involved in cellulose biosynthesis